MCLPQLATRSPRKLGTEDEAHTIVEDLSPSAAAALSTPEYKILLAAAENAEANLTEIKCTSVLPRETLRLSRPEPGFVYGDI